MDIRISKYVCTKTVSDRNSRLKWMSNKLFKMVGEKRNKYKRAKQSGLVHDKINYIRLRNNCTAEVRKAKMKYELEIAGNIKKNPRAFYLHVNTSKKCKDSIGPLKVNGITIEKPREMAEEFNKYFASVSNNDDS